MLLKIEAKFWKHVPVFPGKSDNIYYTRTSSAEINLSFDLKSQDLRKKNVTRHQRYDFVLMNLFSSFPEKKEKKNKHSANIAIFLI